APGPPPSRRSVVRAVTLRRLPAAALAAAAVLRPVGPGVGPPAPVGAEARVLRLLRVLPGVRVLRVLLLRRVRLPLLRCVGLPLLRGLRVGAVALPLRPATALRRALRSAALPAVPHRCLLRGLGSGPGLSGGAPAHGLLRHVLVDLLVVAGQRLRLAGDVGR